MLLSIVICSHNRSASLAETLAGLKRCVSPDSWDCETIVVANACTDDTINVARKAGVHFIEVAEPGLSRARNEGISTANGDAILWLDDDVTPSLELLVEYCEALRQHPGTAFFGGPIRPVLLGNPPRWACAAKKKIPTVWSARDLGPVDRDLDVSKNEYPFGANMLFRQSALQGWFRLDLGRRAGAHVLIGAEESEFFRRISRRGAKGRWVARAAVEHRIGPDRQTLRYVARYFQGVGHQSVVLNRIYPSQSYQTGLRRELRLVRQALRYLAFRLLRPAEKWLPAYAALNRTLGQRSACHQDVQFVSRK